MTTNLCGTRAGLPPSGACAPAPSKPTGTADSTNTFSPQMTGVPDPRPGISTFQRTFFVSLHSSGGSAVFDTPVAYGPRHCGQNFSGVLCASAGTTDMETSRAAASLVTISSVGR